MSAFIFEKIKSLLDSNNVNYKLAIHEPVRTSEEAAAIRGVDISTGAKAMIVKTSDGVFYLFVLPADKRLDWKKVKQILQVRDVTLATTEEVLNLTGVEVGGVPPFGNVMGLKTYFDEDLQTKEVLNFNAGLRTHSVSMSPKDLVELVQPIICSSTK